jgi:hypothetical protein
MQSETEPSFWSQVGRGRTGLPRCTTSRLGSRRRLGDRSGLMRALSGRRRTKRVLFRFLVLHKTAARKRADSGTHGNTINSSIDRGTHTRRLSRFGAPLSSSVSGGSSPLMPKQVRRRARHPSACASTCRASTECPIASSEELPSVEELSLSLFMSPSPGRRLLRVRYQLSLAPPKSNLAR